LAEVTGIAPVLAKHDIKFEVKIHLGGYARGTESKSGAAMEYNDIPFSGCGARALHILLRRLIYALIYDMSFPFLLYAPER
jgi:hypothetical protein